MIHYIIKTFIFLLFYFIEFDVKSETFSKENVESCLKNEVLQKINNMDFHIRLNSWNNNWEQDTNNSITVKEISYMQNDKRFKATIEYGKNKKILVGEIVKKIKLPILTQAISGQAEIDSSLISLQEFDEDKITGDVVTLDKDLLGMQIKQGRLIKAQTPIRKSDLEKPLVIKKGDEVRLFYVDPSFEVSTIAHAKSNGSIGDKITCEVSGKKFVQATIVHEGRVEIRAQL